MTQQPGLTSASIKSLVSKLRLVNVRADMLPAIKYMIYRGKTGAMHWQPTLQPTLRPLLHRIQIKSRPQTNMFDKQQPAEPAHAIPAPAYSERYPQPAPTTTTNLPLTNPPEAPPHPPTLPKPQPGTSNSCARATPAKQSTCP
jgi:hypothetical protein